MGSFQEHLNSKNVNLSLVSGIYANIYWSKAVTLSIYVIILKKKSCSKKKKYRHSVGERKKYMHGSLLRTCRGEKNIWI